MWFFGVDVYETVFLCTLFGYIFGTNTGSDFMHITQIVDGYRYEYDIPSGLAVVTVFGGDIPRSAFYGCRMIAKIIIGSDVERINEGAFAGCGGLTDITLPFVGFNANTTFLNAKKSTLFGYIFGTDEYDGGVETEQSYSEEKSVIYYLPSSLKRVTVTGGKLYFGAFSGCNRLTEITIGEGIAEIGSSVFEGCVRMNKLSFVSPGGWTASRSEGEAGSPIDLSEPSANVENIISGKYAYYCFNKT